MQGNKDLKGKKLSTYSIGVVLHFKELKLSEAYTDTVINESLFLL
jgi:hypothetical protein